jgi:phage-related protein
MAADGALKVGDVYVVVSAAIGDFAKSMKKVLKNIEDTARKAKEAAKGIGEVGAIFAAGMGAALMASSQTNAAVAADLQRLKDYLYTFAAEIGDALAPYLRQVTEAVGQLLAAFQRLPPGVKEAAAKGIAFMAVIGGLGMASSKAAGLLEGVAKAAGIVLVPALNAASAGAKLLGAAMKESTAGKGMLAGLKGMEAGVGQAVAKMAISFAGLLVPILAVVAAVAVVALAAGAVYEAWKNTSTGLKATVLDIWQAAKDLGTRLFNTVGGWLSALQEGLMRALRAVLEGAAFVLRKIGSLMAPVMRALELDSLAGMYEEMSNLTGVQLLKDLQTSATFLVDKAAVAGEAIKDAAVGAGKNIVTSVKYGAKGLERMWKDIGAPAWLEKLLGGAGGGPSKRGGAGPPLLGREARGGAARRSAEIDFGAVEPAFEAAMDRATAAHLKRLRLEAQALAMEMAAAVAEARRAIGERFLGSLGEFSNLMNAAAQGLQAGGPLGAAVAVLGELLMKSEGFAQLVEILNAILANVADALGAIFVPLQQWYAALSMVIDGALAVLTPVIELLAAVIAPLIPPMVVLGTLFQALAPVISLVVQMMLLINAPLQLLAGPVMEGLFKVLKFVSIVILKVVSAIAEVWNDIIRAIRTVFRKLADIEVLGVKPLGFLDDWADGLRGAMVNTDELAASIVALEGLTWDSAKAKAEEIAETLRTRDALKDVNEQLTNIPRGFKIARERYLAQDPVTGLPSPSAPVPPPTAPPPPAAQPPPPGTETNPGTAPGQPGTGGSGGPLIQWGNVTITGMDPQKALAELERIAENNLRRVLGSRGGNMSLLFGPGGG